MPHEQLSPGEIEILIDGESDDVAFDWVLIHLGIHTNAGDRPGPPTVDEALAAIAAVEGLVTAGLVRIGRVEYIDGGPPGRFGPIKHVSEPVDVVRRRVVSHLQSGDLSDEWRWLLWVVNTESGDTAARHALAGNRPPTDPNASRDTAKIRVRREASEAG